MADTASYDYTQSVAALLRQGTATAHEKAENSEGAALIIRGELEKAEYVRFVIMLYHVYDILERALDDNATHPVLAPTYNPTVLARTAALSADIAHLLDVPESSWKEQPVAVELATNPPAPFAAYTSRLHALVSNDPATPGPAGLLAHAYVRYLGDLSGGQFLRRRIAKAYGLDEEGGAGVEFYDFGALDGKRRGTMGDLKKVKEWYRDGMNAGVGDDKELKKSLVDEANIAFQLNGGLFSALRSSKKPSSDAADAPKHPHIHRVYGSARPPLGDPTTPSSPTSVPQSLSAPLLSDGSVTVAQNDNAQSKSLSDKEYSVSTVVAFIAAVCIAHFALVVGGVVGSKGWLASLFPVQA